ncbi:MAG: hypothetical protein R3A51_00615 [Nannocystaceae bacterium]
MPRSPLISPATLRTAVCLIAAALAFNVINLLGVVARGAMIELVPVTTGVPTIVGDIEYTALGLARLLADEVMSTRWRALFSVIAATAVLAKLALVLLALLWASRPRLSLLPPVIVALLGLGCSVAASLLSVLQTQRVGLDSIERLAELSIATTVGDLVARLLSWLLSVALLLYLFARATSARVDDGARGPETSAP